MTDETVVAIYTTSAIADAAARDVEAIGVPQSAITRHSGNQSDAKVSVPEKGFWSRLFGGDPGETQAIIDRSLARGSSVVIIKTQPERVQQVTDVLERHDPIDPEEVDVVDTKVKREATTTPPPAAKVVPAGNPAGAEVLALSEEELVVGKRLVNRGTTRVRRFVVESPAEEAVTLHSESVAIERRPVAPGARSADPDFTDRVVEVTETAEEAVVGKTAHVREEVVISKTEADRVEKVRGTVRREDVEIVRDAQPAAAMHTAGSHDPTPADGRPAREDTTNPSRNQSRT